MSFLTPSSRFRKYWELEGGRDMLPNHLLTGHDGMSSSDVSVDRGFHLIPPHHTYLIVYDIVTPIWNLNNSQGMMFALADEDIC